MIQLAIYVTQAAARLHFVVVVHAELEEQRLPISLVYVQMIALHVMPLVVSTAYPKIPPVVRHQGIMISIQKDV